MNTLALATLEALIGLELMALASISKYKATVYKTWSSLATKYQHLASDTCTENDSQFVFSLPYLPEKVQPDIMFDPEYSSDEMLDNIWGCTDFDFDAKVADDSNLADDYNILFDSDGYQVAQQLVLVFYVWLQSIFASCLDFLDKVIQIAHNTRYILIYHVTNDDAFVFIDIGETT